MTFLVHEHSHHDNSPIELYKFTQNGVNWTWTPGDIDLVADGLYYQQANLIRTEVLVSGSRSEDVVEIEVPFDNPIAMLFAAGFPEDLIELTIFRVQRADVSSPFDAGSRQLSNIDDLIKLWQGRVRAVNWENDVATISCDLRGTSAARHAPRKLYSRMCNNMLFDGSCRVVESEWVSEMTVTFASGLWLTAVELGAFPNDHFKYGTVVRQLTTGAQERRMIYQHYSNKITLLIPFIAVENGEVMTVYPGCNRTLATCYSRFDNVLNFGGFPGMPRSNPFKGGIA
jgi:uncharacterized phage protein (TIGR02218 family)